jgi:hypothetical protein
MPPAVVVSGDEVIEVPTELLVFVVMVAVHRNFFDGAVHPLNLTIGRNRPVSYAA